MDIVKTVSLLIVFILTIFTLLLLHIGRHTKSNIYLAIYFISQIVVELCFFVPYGNLFHLILTSICYSWGQFYYLFVISLLKPEFTFRFKTLSHFIPFLLALTLIIGNHYNVFIHYNNRAFEWINRNYDNLMDTFFNILIIGYSIAIILRYLYHFSKTNKSKASTIWIKVAVFGFLIACLIVQFTKYFKLPFEYEFLIGNTTFLIFFCILLYIAIVNRTITDKLNIIEKYKNSSLNSSISNEILEQVETYMLEETAYLDPELSLKNLSMSLHIQEKYISEVINKLKGTNFSEFVNFYRISHAKDLLKNPENKDKTMLYILFESGFNSKTTFNTRFKQIVGCTPLEYKNKLKN